MAIAAMVATLAAFGVVCILSLISHKRSETSSMWLEFFLFGGAIFIPVAATLASTGWLPRSLVELNRFCAELRYGTLGYCEATQPCLIFAYAAAVIFGIVYFFRALIWFGDVDPARSYSESEAGKAKKEGVVIGVTGVSRCGKGWLSTALHQALVTKGKGGTIVRQDQFWFLTCQKKIRGQIRKSDHEPECIDHDELAQAIETHASSHDFVIVEGTQLLHDSKVVDKLKHIFLLELGVDEARKRRTEARHPQFNPAPLTPEDFDDLLWPAHEKYMKEKVAPLGKKVHRLRGLADARQKDETVRRIMALLQEPAAGSSEPAESLMNAEEVGDSGLRQRGLRSNQASDGSEVQKPFRHEQIAVGQGMADLTRAIEEDDEEFEEESLEGEEEEFLDDEEFEEELVDEEEFEEEFTEGEEEELRHGDFELEEEELLEQTEEEVLSDEEGEEEHDADAVDQEQLEREHDKDDSSKPTPSSSSGAAPSGAAASSELAGRETTDKPQTPPSS
jgi:uridine kinase